MHVVSSSHPRIVSSSHCCTLWVTFKNQDFGVPFDFRSYYNRSTTISFRTGVGDQAIWHIGKTLALHTRTSDYAFRYGGDEFAIILPDTDAAGGIELAERLRVKIENNPMHFEGVEIRLTVSMGVATYVGQNDDATEMVQAADARLYKSKKGGRNCVC